MKLGSSSITGPRELVGDFREAVSVGLEAESLTDGWEFEFGDGGSSIEGCGRLSASKLISFFFDRFESFGLDDLDVLGMPLAITRSF